MQATEDAVAPRAWPAVRARYQLTLGLTPEPAEVGRARRALASCLTGWRLNGGLDAALLVVSELVGNAIRHVPNGTVRLTATAGDGELLIEVRDQSRTPPVLDVGPEPENESGRGLLLVHALSRDWGWTPDGDGAKTTWAVLPAYAASPTRRPLMDTDFAAAPLPVCGSPSHLSAQLVPVALAFASPGAAECGDVERELKCVLQAHTRGRHHAFVMHLAGPDTGSVWASWPHGSGGTLELAVLPDCPAMGGREACCGYERHPGGHTYELADLWRGFVSPEG